MTERRKVPKKRIIDMRNTSGTYSGASQPGPYKVPFLDKHSAFSGAVPVHESGFHSVIVLFVNWHEQLVGSRNAPKSPDGFMGFSAPIFRTFSIA